MERGRARVAALLVAGAMIVSAVWALNKEPPAPPPSTSPTATATVAQAPPPPLETTPVIEPPSPAPVVSALPDAGGKPDPRCPDGLWTEDDLAQKGNGRGCLVAVPDGGVVRDGFWTVRDVDGNIKSGNYQMGRYDGRWVSVYPNGKTAWEMSFVNGVPNGWRTDWNDDGFKVAEHFFRDGALDGMVTITYPDGQVIHEEWRMGVRVDQAASAAATP